jgi:tRNA A-37 threonylcarbamoyl transferase component Bud32
MSAGYDVIEREDNQIVKLFHKGVPRARAEEEVHLTQLARSVGLESPFVAGVVEDDGRYGILFDKVIGPNYLEWMKRTPAAWNKLARFFAYEHHEMHMHRLLELPSLKDRLRAIISMGEELPSDTRNKALSALQRLHEGDHVCHGNFTPQNIIISLDGPVMMDWSAMSRGHYLGDVARTSLLIELDSARGTNDDSLDRIKKLLKGAYVTEYMKICGLGDDDLEAWMLPVAVGRLLEDVPGEKETLTGMIESRL